jgi:hypothetical protein
MGPFSFFALLIATFALSSAVLLLGGMVRQRKPKRPASAVRSFVAPASVPMGHSCRAGETSASHRP